MYVWGVDVCGIFVCVGVCAGCGCGVVSVCVLCSVRVCCVCMCGVVGVFAFLMWCVFYSGGCVYFVCVWCVCVSCTFVCMGCVCWVRVNVCVGVVFLWSGCVWRAPMCVV